MCGIAGLIYRTPERYRNLGANLLSLIQPLESRGPDSCGVALYGSQVIASSGNTSIPVKLILRGEAGVSWAQVSHWLSQVTPVSDIRAIADGQQVTLKVANLHHFDLGKLKQGLYEHFPSVRLISVGAFLEIYKEVGSAKSLAQKYGLENFSGSHGIGHTRMATESVVDTHHCHPFTSGFDLSVVHNGQISNYYKLRFRLEQVGVRFETDNDSEVIAHSIDLQLRQGKSLEAALKQLLKDLDGTYTFLVATRDQVGLVRDKFAAKPAVIYQSPELVAIASEYRALMNLPDFDPTAPIHEPDAGEVNVWSVIAAPQADTLQAWAA